MPPSDFFICKEMHVQQSSYEPSISCTPQDSPWKEGNANTLASSTSVLHAKGKRKERAPLVETEVRISKRFRCTTKGFRQTPCINKSCLACHALPPPIKSKVVKNLNVAYCKVNAKDSNVEVLEQKRQKKGNKDKGRKIPKKAWIDLWYHVR